MQDWPERLRNRLHDLGMTPADLIRASGVSRDLVYKYMAGKVTNPRGDIIGRLAKAVGLSPAELRYGVPQSVASRRIPLLKMNKLGTIAEPSHVASVWDGVSVVIVSGELSDQAFAVTLEDDACAPELPAGSAIVCDPASPPVPGKYVVALVPGVGAVLRRYRKREVGAPDFWLISDNADFPDIHVKHDKIATIIGRAIKHIRDI